MTTGFSPLKQSALCAFNKLTRRWTPVSLGAPSKKATPHSTHPSTQEVQKELNIVSWNIDAFNSRPIARAWLILDSLLERQKVPDIIFLQEVTHEVYDSLLGEKRIRKNFFATDAGEDRTAFWGVPFATVILLSRTRFAPGHFEGIEGRDESKGSNEIMLAPATRVVLPSKYGRDGLYVDVCFGAGRAFRLINVHLDSLPATLHNRAQQIEILAGKIRESTCGRGLIAGDFNAISPEDQNFIGENGLRDQWIALHGEESSGHTWGVDINENDRFPPGRLDKVATIGMEAASMEVLLPGSIAVPGSAKGIPWSDHCGLICSFNI